jgi:acyl carrier protein
LAPEQTDTRARVLRAVSHIMGVPADQLGDASSPDSIAAWDSLRHMNLMLSLEEEFGVRFSDDQIMTMTSVGAIVAEVNGRRR